MSEKDRPGGILEIPASLGRDIDRAAEGKIAPPPIEAFLSDAALSEIDAATAAADGPLHAETLRPISRAEASARTTFNGETLPKAPVTRRVIPAPFQRSRVTGGSHGKEWVNITASQVRCGDIVPDVGLVTGRAEKVRYASRSSIVPEELEEIDKLFLDPLVPNLIDGTGLARTWGTSIAVGLDVTLTGAGGVSKTFDAQAAVRAFRARAVLPVC